MPGSAESHFFEFPHGLVFVGELLQVSPSPNFFQQIWLKNPWQIVQRLAPDIEKTKVDRKKNRKNLSHSSVPSRILPGPPFSVHLVPLWCCWMPWSTCGRGLGLGLGPPFPRRRPSNGRTPGPSVGSQRWRWRSMVPWLSSHTWETDDWPMVQYVNIY